MAQVQMLCVFLLSSHFLVEIQTALTFSGNKNPPQNFSILRQAKMCGGTKDPQRSSSRKMIQNCTYRKDNGCHHVQGLKIQGNANHCGTLLCMMCPSRQRISQSHQQMSRPHVYIVLLNSIYVNLNTFRCSGRAEIAKWSFPPGANIAKANPLQKQTILAYFSFCNTPLFHFHQHMCSGFGGTAPSLRRTSLLSLISNGYMDRKLVPVYLSISPVSK